MIIISKYDKGALNAGPKAKTDVEYICNKEFGANIKTYGDFIKENKYKRFIKKLLAKINLFFSIKKKEITIIQIPFSKYTFITSRIKNKVAFIHDIEGLRYNDSERLSGEINVLSRFNYIVAHNDSMKKFLVERGIDKSKIYTLDLFDYICTEKPNKISKKFNAKNIKIAYAGNLSKEKSPFLHQIDSNKMNFNILMYGVGIDKSINEKIIYIGAFKPEQLPDSIDADLGLVWDGNYDETDETADFKNYTKYNNPHKLSCYIAAGIPVIVWKKSAISKFVEKENIGYTISNIYDINKIDFSDYNTKKKNVQELQKKVRKGYFTTKVIKEIIERLQKDSDETNSK